MPGSPFAPYWNLAVSFNRWPAVFLRGVPNGFYTLPRIRNWQVSEIHKMTL